MTSLPVPVSPVISTVESVWPTISAFFRSCFAAFEPPINVSLEDASAIRSRRSEFSPLAPFEFYFEESCDGRIALHFDYRRLISYLTFWINVF